MSSTRPTGGFAMPPARAGFHLMAKPSGPACNLDCSYCFYLEKEAALYSQRKQRRMSDEVLEAYVRNTIASTPAQDPVLFAWQGGEPTLLGLDFYRRALALQQKHGAHRRISNSFQTNGVLIDEEWAAFLAGNGFLVGLSLDGPADIHDSVRRYRSGAPSHHLVMAALERLQRHGVEYNVLACVGSHSESRPLEVYRFLKASGVDFIQFTPVVERLATGAYRQAGFELQGPDESAGAAVAPFTTSPHGWGEFLVAVFDEWRSHDVGKTFVMNFEWTLASLLDVPGGVCVHQEECGRAIVVDYDGDVYSCDHYVYPDYRLGNLARQGLAAMVDSPQQQAFGRAKSETLPEQCRRCPHLKLCRGGCPKHRFAAAPQSLPGVNYLCEGYTRYFAHVTPVLRRVGALLKAGRDPAEIMQNR